MTDKRKIEILSGLKPVHSFDLWGVLIDQSVLGERNIGLYEKKAGLCGVAKEESKRTVQNYRDLLDGKSWATGARKGEIIDALEGKDWFREIQMDYTVAFMQDALEVMGEILAAGEGVIIFTSKPAPHLREQLASTLGRDVGDVRWGGKGDPGAFQSVYDLEIRLGNRLVSHTADELPELVAAVKSGLFAPEGLIYVNRNESNSEDDVGEVGIERYVNDLREVKYTALCSPPAELFADITNNDQGGK